MCIDKLTSRHLCSVVALVIMVGILAALAPREVVAKERGLSQDWRFFKGEVAGAEKLDFDDSKWQTLVVPHDWSIMDRAGSQSPFNPDTQSGHDSGYLSGGTAWYRRQFVLTEQEAGKNVRLKFDAVYMDADIWLNGQHLTSHHYGYTAFKVDLTGKVRPGSNVVAVRVRHADPSSRWYAGSGIIQPVALEILNCVHIDPDATFVTTPVATEKLAKVEVSARIKHCETPPEVHLQARIVDNSGVIVASTETQKQRLSAESTEWELSMSVENPSLWSLETPNLYTLVQEVSIDGRVMDERRTRFGIRSITLDANKGLRLNGKNIELKGGNIHHDNYMLGAAGFPDADARKVRLMKQAGYNAIRSAHNPASQATLNAADELGMLVINEAFDSWNKHKRAKDYSRFFATDWQADIDSLVISGRNHPSVLFWSIGNEIPEQGTALGIATAQALAERVRKLDPSRPITQAVSTIESPDIASQYAAVDVAGYNYQSHLFAPDHSQYPDRVMYSSESVPKNAFKVWQTVEDMPWVIGDFVWTSIDYLGEAGIGWMGYSQDWQKLGPYPWHLAYCGEIDATGRKRPAAYYREVIWKSGLHPISAFVQQPEGTADLPDRHYFKIEPPHLDWSLEDLHPSWTWPGQENNALNVFIYSEYPEVELFLNGKSLGRKAVGHSTQYKTLYRVPYQPGLLRAVAYNQEGEVGSWELRTAGAATGASVQADRHMLRANGQDLAYVSVELTDQNGTAIYAPSDDRMVHIQVEGAAELIAMGNGNPMDASSFQSGLRKTFHGRVVAVVRAGTEPGQITVRVAVEGQPEQQQVLHLTSVDSH